VKAGFAVSLARPGGNLTGLTLASQDLAAKRLELLREIVPGVKRIGLLVNPESKGSTASAKDAEAAAKSLRLELQTVQARASTEFETAFTDLVKANVGAVFSTPSTMFTAHREQIVQIAARHRLPTMFYGADYVEAGGLVAYGTDQPDAFRRAADYVAKILRGDKPGDLPIEQPTKFELVLNMKTAKAIGLKIPQSVLLRSDRLIE
jgi:putative ABC transport system substrate-binding protein